MIARRMISLLVGAFALGLAACSAEAETGTWAVSEFSDPETTATVEAATTTNDAGFSAAIFRSDDGKVRWVLALPRGTFDRLVEGVPTVTGTRIASLRIDSLDSWDIRVTTSPTAQPTVGGTWFRTILWHGEGASPTRGTLRNMLDGQLLSVRFFLDDGNRLDTAFPLDGAPEAIAEVLDIQIKADPAIAAGEGARDDAIVAATRSCMAKADSGACTQAVVSCISGDLATLTGDQVRACMAEAGHPMP